MQGQQISRHATCAALTLICECDLQDLLGFRLDEAVEKEKGAATGLVSLSRPTSVASDLAHHGTGWDE